LKSPLLLDISRLILGAKRVGPTGIDRIELAYAQHFLAEQASRPVSLVLHVSGLLFAVSRQGGRRFIEDLSARWQGSAPTGKRGHFVSVIKTYVQLFTSVWIPGPWLRRKLKRQGSPPIFLVVSHHHVGHGYTIRRIRRTFGARTVCFIHDLIPIDFPEYCKPRSGPRHQRAIANVGRLFDAAIVNSETTAVSLRSHLAADPGNTASKVKIRVAMPGVRAFPVPDAAAKSPDRPYFVMLATIEPKKNHLLLLNLWTRLATSIVAPPQLLVIGSRGWDNEQVVDMLERSRRLRGLVFERSHLADADVGLALKGARALLAPSLAEGFGLPLAEALASGTPVICSDIPAFREVGLGVPDYLDPLDLLGWMDAVMEYSRPDSNRRAAQMTRLAQWRAPGWAEHFQAVGRLLDDLDPC
jgi:glycosyltransferase involved in cell wall biosynthesis